MTYTVDIVRKIAEYETAGFTRSEAIEIVKIEQMIIIGNRLTNISNKLDSSSISDT